MGVASGAANGLDESALRAQEALFVGIKDGDKGNFGKVQAFAKQVDTHQYIELPQSQASENFDSFDRVNIAMQITDLNSVLHQERR